MTHAPEFPHSPDLQDKTLVLNGRFLTRPMTGVDRVASELACAMQDRVAAEDSAIRSLAIALPKAPIAGPDMQVQQLGALPRRAASRLNGHLWEQLALPLQARGDMLLSFCNTGPLVHRRQVVMIHDAQVFTQPETYSRSFRMLYHQLLPRLARRAEVLLTVSDFSKRELEKHGVFPNGKAHVIHNGADHIDRVTVDDGILARHELRPGGFFFAMGSLARPKNLPMLVAASEARADRTLPLVIAGGGNSTIFRDNGLPESPSLRYLGRVSDGELKALYQSARAFLFPSLTEGFGLPPVEAMRCGSAVVATTGGAVPEVCGDAVLYADPHDPVAWERAMTQLADDPAITTHLANQGRAYAQGFTWARAADKLLSYLGSGDKF